MKDKVKDYLIHNKSLNFNELLFSYIDKSGCKDSEIYKRVDIDRKLFSKNKKIYNLKRKIIKRN